MSTLSLKHIYKIYPNGVPAVKDFCMDINDKEFVVFVGPSGCGKSTTLRMIAGLEGITDGELYIGDKLMNTVEPKDRNIAMVFQNYALYPHMTVYNNIAFGLKLRKVAEEVTGKDGKTVTKYRKLTKDEIHEKVMEAARILDIEDYLERKPKALSGGQRQRVAIGRAIVRKPEVFLFDEPLSNLDAKLRNQMRSELILLRKKINTTFIYVTHDQTEAMTLGDRIVIMKGGVVQQIGTPQEVFDKPTNLFVAGFIGSPQMNFLNANLTLENGAYGVDVYGVHVNLTAEQQEILKEKQIGRQVVTMGIRPEHMTLSLPGHGGIPCTVSVSEMMGSEIYLHVNLTDGKDIIVRVPTLGMEENLRRSLVDGGKVEAHVPGNAVHLFSIETEDNILFA